MRIIPAIDIIDAQCVRLSQGRYQQKTTYSKKPLEVAKTFEDAGLKHLHLVDLDGAKSREVQNLAVLEAIATHTKLHIDFGGGLKSTLDVERVFNAGAKQITGGSIAAKNPVLFGQWLVKYGAEKIILGADFREGKIAVNGWQETTDLSLLAFLEDYFKRGIRYVIPTDISKDGMLAGSAKSEYQKIREALPQIKLIASGGVHNMADLEQLKALGCEGAIIGKALYEGKISLKQLQALC